MIKWSKIDSEVEEFQSGYRSVFVTIFKKYEGMETDERDGANRVVKVTVRGFARRYGIGETTFQTWVNQEVRPDLGRITPRTPSERALAEAASKAKAEAEAKAEKALEAQAKRSAEAAAKALEHADRQQKAAVVAERTRVEAQAKADARKEAEKKIKEIQAKLEQEFKAREFDPSHLTPSQRSEIMVLLANDPAEAKRWFKAYEDERKRKLSAANAKAVEANRKRLEQMQDRERRSAHQRASKEFEDSALKMFSSLADLAAKCQKLLQTKPVTFNHLITSGLSANDWVKMTEDVEDVAVAFRESIFEANAAEELSEIK
jgi:hypothetical protein